MEDSGREGAVAHEALGTDMAPMSFRELGSERSSAATGVNGPGLLSETIESELLPRFMIAFQSVGTDALIDYVTEVDHGRFYEGLLADDVAQSLTYIRQLERRGVPVSRLFSDLLARAAHRLGEDWEDDRLNFSEVTLAMTRLQQMVRMVSVIGDHGFHRMDGSAHRILLTTARGEQHDFGVQMAAEAFRRDGWFVVSEPATGVDELKRIVSKETFDMIGLSASTDRALDRIGADVASLRSASRNTDMQVLVGGSLFQRNPGLATEIGAVFCASDAMSAPRMCRRLLAQSLVGC